MRESFKKIVAISGFILLSSLLASEVALAATDFVPLAPLPGTTQGCSGGGGQQCITPATYLPGIFKLGIGIVSALAVLAIAYGGIKYMTSDVVTSKSDSIQLIKNSMLGLLLALGSYLILYTINPDLVSTNFADIPEGNPLPAPVNIGGGGGGDVGSGKYELTYFYNLYQFVYQRYDWAETFYTKGGQRLVQYRFETEPLCVAAGRRDVNAGLIDDDGYTCTRVKALVNYTYGNSPRIVLPTDKEEAEQRTLKASLQLCESFAAPFLADTNKYTALYLPNCHETPGESITHYYEVEASCLAELRQQEALKAVITTRCK